MSAAAFVKGPTYLKLATAPALRHPGHPLCDACEMETSPDDGSWLCPGCGTTWPIDRLEDDGSSATLYEDWSGETLHEPVCPTDFAWQVAHLPPEDRARRIAKASR